MLLHFLSLSIGDFWFLSFHSFRIIFRCCTIRFQLAISHRIKTENHFSSYILSSSSSSSRHLFNHLSVVTMCLMPTFIDNCKSQFMQSPNERQPIKNPWIELKSIAEQQPTQIGPSSKLLSISKEETDFASNFWYLKPNTWAYVYLRDRDGIFRKSFTIH